MGWGYYGFRPYVSVAQKQAKAQRMMEKLRKNGRELSPVAVEGRKIAKTWWGEAWTRNLERYSDYENRIGRGRSYVSNGFVLDLKIATGRVEALVVGTSPMPYDVSVAIDKLSEEQWEAITKRCGNRVENLEALAEGKFPKDLADLFTDKETGLFPTPKEIHFDCSCPDWASMCKHVAATLYGVGARLDKDPLLFFTLRDVDVHALLKKSVAEKMERMLENAGKKTRRVLDGADVKALFGL